MPRSILAGSRYLAAEARAGELRGRSETSIDDRLSRRFALDGPTVTG